MEQNQTETIVRKLAEECNAAAMNIINAGAQSIRAQIVVLLNEVSSALIEKLRLEENKAEASKQA